MESTDNKILEELLFQNYEQKNKKKHEPQKKKPKASSSSYSTPMYQRNWHRKRPNAYCDGPIYCHCNY